MTIIHDDQEIGKRREDVHLAQGLNYLDAYKLDRGLLINFGARSLEVKRLLNPRTRNKTS